MKCLASSTDYPNHQILLRTYVSRKASSKGRAVLEGVGLQPETIEGCFNNHPQNEEEAVQAGLIKWSSGQGYSPPTWLVLLHAMNYAQIAEKHVQGLKKVLELGMLLTSVSCMWQLCACMHACMCVCVYVCDYPYMSSSC